jgi:hypothetical protein
MKIQNQARLVFAVLSLSSVSLFAQTVTSSIVGAVVDPANAVVSGAPVTLNSVDTGEVRTGTTDSLGNYRFAEVKPGNYNIVVKATGFKSETQTGIVVTAEETHNAGKMILQLGSVSESISVTAEAAAVQLQSSEKSQTVDSADLDDLTLKGRDLFGYVRLVPGVIDTASRDVTSHGAISGMNINGGFTALNFTVDGVTDMDTGSNTSLQVEPNLDAVQELKVLTSNFQAEFGHNSGGQITVVTKNGTQEFHGTAAWNHRHEEFNADTWANNHTLKNGAATPRVPYRYNVETYSIGGPVFIPKHFNRDRKRLFFFWSQERTGQFVSGGSESVYTPTALERNGDFSQTFNNNGTAIKLLDPSNGNVQFANNMIPASRLNPVGQAMLNFFPLPNFTPVLANQLNVVNYFEQASAIHPRLNSVARSDIYINSKLSGYVRWLNDADYMYNLYDGVQFSTDIGGLLGAKGISPINHPNGGHSDSGTLTYTISPTMVNETTLAYNWDQYTYITTDNFATEARSLIPNIPTLFPVPTDPSQGINGYANPTILPTFSFGSLPTGNLMSYGRTGAAAGQEIATNPTWYYMDNISKIVGHHSLKAGIYVEFNTKYQGSYRNYAGAYSFGASTSTPFLNSGDGLANALLGNVSSYTQWNETTTFNFVYQNYEEYFQDNWKVNRRLTLDLGVRFYHQSPQEDNNFTNENFFPSLYSKSAQARLYTPFCSNGAATCTANNGLVARDPATGATVSSSQIGDLVPNSGLPASGMQVLGGPGGVPEAPYHQQALVAAPRLGFAYDLFGDGKTAFRGGWGIFYNRLDGNQYYGLSGQAPEAYAVSVSNLTLGQISAANTGTVPSLSTQAGVSPVAPTVYPAQVPWDTVQSASAGLQHTFGSNLVVDIGYTLQYVYHEHLTYDENYIPVGGEWPFNAANLDPTTGGNTSNNLNSNLERNIYPGYGSITVNQFLGHSTYNALTSTINKRYSHGLSLGTAFTYSKAMGTTSYSPVLTGTNGVPSNEQWNYGRIGTDRPINLQINYSYDIPGIAKKMGVKGLGYITDHWQFSGITAVQSGAPFNPGCGLTSGAASVTGGYTGTPDVGQRCAVIGNPLANVPAGTYFNPNAFAMPALATGPNNSIVGPPALGNLGGGAGVLTYPHITNFDMTMTKIIPLGSEKRVLKIQAQAYNAFNHSEFNGMNTGITFNPTTNQVSNANAVGLPTGTANARIMAFSARLQF